MPVQQDSRKLKRAWADVHETGDSPLLYFSATTAEDSLIVAT